MEPAFSFGNNFNKSQDGEYEHEGADKHRACEAALPVRERRNRKEEEHNGQDEVSDAHEAHKTFIDCGSYRAHFFKYRKDQEEPCAETYDRDDAFFGLGIDAGRA